MRFLLNSAQRTIFKIGVRAESRTASKTLTQNILAQNLSIPKTQRQLILDDIFHACFFDSIAIFSSSGGGLKFAGETSVDYLSIGFIFHDIE